MSRRRMGATTYKFLADLVLVVHFGFVIFVVFGLIVIWIGFFANWKFVRNPWLRLAHLTAMAVVVAESVFGVICPLTTWEAEMRLKTGEGQTYAGSFVQHWVHRLMFFECSEQAFTAIYVAVFVLILFSFVFVRPRPFRAPRPT